MTLFFNEFKQNASKRDIQIPGNIDVAYLCVELYWGKKFEIEILLEDPAFVIETAKRWIAIHRVGGEIRYYAGPLPELCERGYCYERGVLFSADDAVDFVNQYLSNIPLANIDIKRIRVGYNET